MIRLVLVGVLVLLTLVFFLQNQQQEVTLRYFSLATLSMQEDSTPVYKPVLSALVVGLLVASILLFPPWVRGRLELKRKTRALQEAEADLDQLRRSLRKASGERTGAPPSDADEHLDE
jgi:uncharacterized integral membrane protein